MKIHCNKYLGTHRVMSVRYPGSKISTRFNPTYKNRMPDLTITKLKHRECQTYPNRNQNIMHSTASSSYLNSLNLDLCVK